MVVKSEGNQSSSMSALIDESLLSQTENEQNVTNNDKNQVEKVLKEKLLNDTLASVCIRCCTSLSSNNRFYKLKFLDNLDNGFSIMLRIPGSISKPKICVTDLTIDCYLTNDGHDDIEMKGKIATLVQEFAEGITCKHLESIWGDRVVRLNEAELQYLGLSNTTLIPPANESHPCYYKFAGHCPGQMEERILWAEIDEKETKGWTDEDWDVYFDKVARLEKKELGKKQAASTHEAGTKEGKVIPNKH